jgi:hypothetical protein
MTLYAGHDRVMYALMRALDIYDPFALRGPPLGAALMFELHQDSLQQRELVKIFYRNDTQVEPEELKVPDCGDPCTLSDFVEKAKDFIPIDYEKECQVSNQMALVSAFVPQEPHPGTNSWLYVLGVAGVAAAACVAIAMTLFVSARKSKHYFPV